MKRLEIVEQSLDDLIYDLVIYHVRDSSQDTLDGFVCTKKDGIEIEIAVSVECGTITVWRRTPLDEEEKQDIMEMVREKEKGRLDTHL